MHPSSRLVFPTSRPEHDAPEVWRIQGLLLQIAETLLGPRDQSKTICQPIFGQGNPHIINTPNFDGAFACLSMAAAGYWQTFVYELAHETVHLLNPTVGRANVLEEGTAVAFSVQMSLALTDHPMQPDANSPYAEALALVSSLSLDVLTAGRLVRSRVQALSAATFDVLRDCFPQVEDAILQRLIQPC